MKILLLDGVCLVGKASLLGAAGTHAFTPLGVVIGFLLLALTLVCALCHARKFTAWLLAPPPDPSQTFSELIEIDELRRKEELAVCLELQRARMSGTFA
jgi:hypothetical protein